MTASPGLFSRSALPQCDSFKRISEEALRHYKYWFSLWCRTGNAGLARLHFHKTLCIISEWSYFEEALHKQGSFFNGPRV